MKTFVFATLQQIPGIHYKGSMRALCRYFQRLPKYFMPSCPGADNLFDMENALFNSCTGHSGALYPSYFVRQDAGNGGNECAVAAIAVSLLQ